MRLSVLQHSPALGETETNLASVRETLADVNFDLLVLPELFASGYFFHSAAQVQAAAEPVPGGPTTEALIEMAQTGGGHACGGLVEQAGDRLYNSAVLAGPEGWIGTYRKLHLFYQESRWFTPGDAPPAVYDLGTARVGILICFDWRFPEVARMLALQGAQLLLHPANLVQPHCQAAMVTRALENRVFIATANRIGTDVQPGGESLTFTGRSQIVDPRGNLLSQAQAREPALLEISIDPSEADDKTVTATNHLFEDRRPEHYGILTAPAN